MGICAPPKIKHPIDPSMLKGEIQSIKTTQSNFLECRVCKISDDNTYITLFCTHSYHQECFSKLIIKQIEVNDSYTIKCKCGSKAKSNQIRSSNLPDKLILLNMMFNKQLDILLKQLRKQQDYLIFIQLQKGSQQHGDFYFFPNQLQLEYEETPQ